MAKIGMGTRYAGLEGEPAFYRTEKQNGTVRVIVEDDQERLVIWKDFPSAQNRDQQIDQWLKSTERGIRTQILHESHRR